MQAQRWTLVGLGIGVMLASSGMAADQLPLEPPHNAGQSITGSFEGWYPNEDGTKTILIGYYNRSLKQAVDIPIGPNNHIDPGGPDQGQPTHFLPSRQWGVFTITVPKDFSPDQKLTWTITANGKTTQVPFHLDPLWVVAPFLDATDNTPPYISFDGGEHVFHGPPRGIVKTYTATVGTPLTLDVWVADDAMVPVGMPSAPKTPAAIVSWAKYRGPGDVTFAKARPDVQKAEFKAPPKASFLGKGTTTATFSEPGEYTLEVQSFDWSGEGGRGFQCCWSSAMVKVNVDK